MSEDHDDLAFEPVPGLPAPLPPGESILWRGSPDWRALAISAFHVRKVALYFALLAGWSLFASESGGAEAALAALRVMAAGAVAVAILCGLASLYARGTIYTLTTRRLVFRSGLALPVTLNLPFSVIESAAATRSPGGTTSIALVVEKPHRVALLVLWPNARPWTFAQPQPMLRCLADGEAVAGLLATALEAQVGGAARRAPAREPAATPAVIPAGRPARPMAA